MLLNLVKLRYRDAPVFMDVASVITQTGVQGTVGVTGTWRQNPFSSFAGISALGTYGEKPKVTYVPMSGKKFARSLMTPISPGAILRFLQAGYPADIVLRLAVHTSNGIHSRYGYGARAREADPEFFPLVEKLRNIQRSGQIGLRVKRTGTQTATAIVFSKKITPAIEAERDEVRKLLGLSLEADEIDVVYGSVAAHDKGIALLTRSVLEILTDLSSYTDVPAANVVQKRMFPSPAPEIVNSAPVPPPIRISALRKNPTMFLFTFTESGDKQGAPIITVPVG